MPRWVEDYGFPIGGSCVRFLSHVILVLGTGLAKSFGRRYGGL